ncbi:MAG: hypothetical protein OIF50_16100 [Flavobacteriaceae bacterium]|nr:hypothetical protein [Flavobacteriaceae bacterium]
MKNIGKASFANKIEKARQLIEKLATMEKFNSNDNKMMVVLQQIFAEATVIKATSEEVEDHKKVLVRRRSHKYHKDADGLMKRLTRINKHLQGTVEIDADAKLLVKKIISNMRNYRSKKKKNTEDKMPPNPVTENPTEGDRKNTLHKSTFGRRLADLQHIISILSSMGPTYTPNAELISIASLQQLSVTLEQLNKDVAKAKALAKKSGSNRNEVAENLAEICKNTKYLVESTYGKESPEYRMVKEIKI